MNCQRNRLKTESKAQRLINPNLLIPLLAFVIRLIYLLHVQSSPYFDSPELDAAMHDRWAQEIAGGDFWGDEAFFRAPLYYYFLALIYYVFGHNYFIPRFIQIILGAFAAWLTYRLGRRIFGERVGLIAGLIYAFCGPLIFFDAELRIPALLMPLLLLTLIQFDKQRESPSNWGYFFAGCLLGLTALARPNILIFIPFVWLWTVIVLRGRFRWVVVFTAGVFLLIAPVTIRNWVVGRDFVPIASQAGVNFYIGNNPKSNGYTAIVPGTPGDWEGGYLATVQIAEDETGRKLKPSEVSGYWFRRALKEMSADLPAWTALTLRKIRLLFSGHEIGNNDDIYFQRRWSWVLGALMWEKIIAFPFGLLLPLGLLGLALNFNWRKNSLLILFFLSYSASIVAFFVCSRYRLPLIPILAIWSGIAVTELYQIIRNRKLKSYLIPILCTMVLFIAVNRNPLAGEGWTDFEGAYYLGNKYTQKGQYDRAIEAYKEALRISPHSAQPYYRLAMIWLKQGKTEDARRDLERAVLEDPTYSHARNNLALILHQQGNPQAALAQYLLVLRQDSTDVFANRGVGDVALSIGEFEQADRYYRRAYQNGAFDAQLMSRWAQALLQQGRVAEALQVNALLLAAEPENARAHHNQARIYMACDSLGRAERELKEVLRLDPENMEAAGQLEEIRKENP